MTDNRVARKLADQVFYGFLAMAPEDRPELAERINEHFRKLGQGVRWELRAPEAPSHD